MALSQRSLNQERFNADAKIIQAAIKKMDPTATSILCGEDDKYQIYRTPQNNYFIVDNSRKLLGASTNGVAQFAFLIDDITNLQINPQPFVLKKIRPRMIDDESKADQIKLAFQQDMAREAKIIHKTQMSNQFDLLKGSESKSVSSVFFMDQEQGCIFMPLATGKPLIKSDLKERGDDRLILNLDMKTQTMPEKLHLISEFSSALYILLANTRGTSSLSWNDLSDGNILYTPQGVNLIDFGTVAEVKSYTDTVDRSEVEGSPGYLTPGAFKRKKSSADDMWGTVPHIAILFGGNNPFKDKINAPLDSALIRNMAKKRLYITPGAIKELNGADDMRNAVVLFKENGHYHAQYYDGTAMEIALNYKIISGDEKEDKPPKDCLVINSKEKTVLFYDLEGKSTELKLESQDNIFTKFPDGIEADTNKNLLKKELIILLKENNLARPRIAKLDLSSTEMNFLNRYTHKLKTTGKDKVEIEKTFSSMTDPIMLKALIQGGQRKEVRNTNEDDKAKELTKKYNLEGMFEGEIYDGWRWLEAPVKKLIENLQNLDPKTRPTPLEFHLFFGILDAFSQRPLPKQCETALEFLSTNLLINNEDPHMNQFGKQATQFLNTLYNDRNRDQNFNMLLSNFMFASSSFITTYFLSMNSKDVYKEFKAELSKISTLSSIRDILEEKTTTIKEKLKSMSRGEINYKNTESKLSTFNAIKNSLAEIKLSDPNSIKTFYDSVTVIDSLIKKEDFLEHTSSNFFMIKKTNSPTIDKIKKILEKTFPEETKPALIRTRSLRKGGGEY